MSSSSPWQRSLRMRSAIIILVGVLGFCLGALYLSVEQMDVDHVVVVTGPPSLRPGEPTVLRVAALKRGSRGDMPIRVKGVSLRVGEESVRELTSRAEGTRPAVVWFTVPEVGDSQATLELLVSVDDRSARTVPVSTKIEAPVELAAATPKKAELPEEGALRIELEPEDAVLVYGMENRLFARVSDAAGLPVPARVEMKLGKKTTLAQDAGADGLAVFELDGERPRYDMKLSATAADGRTGRAEEDLRPAPRGHRMRLMPRVVAPGGRYRLEVTAKEKKETLHCDVLRDGHPVDAFVLNVARGAASVERTAPSATGGFVLQCAAFYRSAGQSFCTATLAVSSDPETAALAALVTPRDSADAAWTSSVSSGHEGGRVADYLAARLVPVHKGAAHLASTLESDRGSLARERQAVREKLLLALGVAFSCLLLWAFVTVAGNLADVRKRSAAMAEVLAEGDDEVGSDSVDPATLDPDDAHLLDVEPPDSFGRARSMTQFVVVVVLLVIDVIAVLWLLGAIVQ